jgi:hypothetical protein
VPKPPLLGFVQFGIKSHSYFLLKNGALSAVPYICQAVFALVGGQLADILRAKKVCFPLQDCSEFGNFVITLIQMHNKTFKTLRQGLPVSSNIRLAAVVAVVYVNV